MQNVVGRSVCGSEKPINPIVVFDTAAQPECDRFGLWRDHVASVLAAFDFDPIEDRPFHARMETLSVGALKVNRGDSATGSWVRRPNHLSDGREHLALYLGGGGAFRMVQGGMDSVHGPHHFALIDDSKPSEFFLETSDGDYGFVLPYDVLHRLAGRAGAFSLPYTGVPTAGLRLLRNYLESIYAAPEDLTDPRVAEMVYDHLLDLIVLGLNPSRDMAYQAQNRGLKAARVQAILAAIEANFAVPGISFKAIAAQLHISQRYLHELLEERGLTFTRMVLEKRLDKAIAMLRDHGRDNLRISQIAYECGFNDLSYFNRRFRARFGETPGGIRGKLP
jgi:AraC-like DNA-binding protein